MRMMIDAVKALCVMLMVISVSVLTSQSAFATEDVHHFDSAKDRALYQELNEQLRCPKCQNQNIADSNANIAKDLRAKVYKLINEGKDKEQIVDYMVERYGYFVYYKPPFNAATMILWLLPIAFILMTLLFIWRKSKDSFVKSNDDGWSDEQQAQLDDLIAQIERGGKG